jgi:hypothetical protein
VLEDDFSIIKYSLLSRSRKIKSNRQTLSLSPGLRVPFVDVGIPGGGVAI